MLIERLARPLRKLWTMTRTTWQLGGWVAKACAVCLPASPALLWGVIFPLIAAGRLSPWAFAVGWTIGHANSMVLLPFLIFWHNGGKNVLTTYLPLLHKLDGYPVTQPLIELHSPYVLRPDSAS